VSESTLIGEGNRSIKRKT